MMALQMGAEAEKHQGAAPAPVVAHTVSERKAAQSRGFAATGAQ